MRKLSGIFAALLLLLSACAPAAAPTEATTPETQGEELVSTLSMLPKQAISIHRADTPAEEDTETDRTDIVFVPYYASVEQLTSNSWVDQTHVTKSTVLNLTKTDAVEVKWEANALLAGGRWVTSQEELQTVCSYLRSRADDGVLHLTDEACSAPAEAFGNADFFAEQKLLLIDLCRLGSDTLLDPVVLRAEDGTVDITLRMSAPTVGEVRGNGMLCLIPVPSGCTGAEIIPFSARRGIAWAVSSCWRALHPERAISTGPERWPSATSRTRA